MSFNVSYIFEAIDEFSGPARAIATSFQKVINQTGKLNSKLEGLHQSLTKAGAAASVRLTAPIAALGVSSLKAASSVEVWRTQWEVYTHSTQKAKEMTQSLMNWAKRTPFRIPDIEHAGIQLAALSVPMKDIPKDLKMLGDISAMTGMPLSVLAQNFGKVHSAGKLMGIELMELRRIGVAVTPEFAALQKKLHLPPEPLQDLVREGKISAKDFDKIIAFMVSKQGLYASGTKKLSMTLKGMYTTVLDNLFLARQSIGDQIVSITNLHSHVVALNRVMTTFTEKLKPWIVAHKHFAAIAVEVGIILAILGPTLIVMGQIAWAVWGLSKAFGIVLIAIRSIFAVSMLLWANPIGLIILAIAAIVGIVVLILHHFYRWKTLAHGVAIAFHIIGKIFKTLWTLLKPILYPFKILGKAIELIGKLLWKHLLSPIDEMQKNLGSVAALMGKISGMKMLGAAPFGAKALGMSHLFPHLPDFLAKNAARQPVAVANQHVVQSNLAISVYDPGRYLKSVTGQSTGNMTFDTGTNMMFGRI
jgi:hypothetical protein